MKILLTLLTVVLFTSGCASTQHARTMTPAEAQLAAKAQYYEELNQRQYRDNIHAIAEIDTKLERASAETVNGIGQ